MPEVARFCITVYTCMYMSPYTNAYTHTKTYTYIFTNKRIDPHTASNHTEISNKTKEIATNSKN